MANGAKARAVGAPRDAAILEVKDGHASDGPPTMRGYKSVELPCPVPPPIVHSDTFDAIIAPDRGCCSPREAGASAHSTPAPAQDDE
jgi:hypothetical protein